MTIILILFWLCPLNSNFIIDKISRFNLLKIIPLKIEKDAKKMNQLLNQLTRQA